MMENKNGKSTSKTVPIFDRWWADQQYPELHHEVAMRAFHAGMKMVADEACAAIERVNRGWISHCQESNKSWIGYCEEWRRQHTHTAMIALMVGLVAGLMAGVTIGHVFF